MNAACDKAEEKGAPEEPAPFSEGVEMPFAAPEPEPAKKAKSGAKSKA